MGKPNSILTDNGSQFTSKNLNFSLDTLPELNIKAKFTATPMDSRASRAEKTKDGLGVVLATCVSYD